MAGVVAMAAVIEDFEVTQPSKKSRKDDDPPPTRTITNYFTPLAKTTEKPFSPPRSNNIMDYFKKTSPAQERSSSQKNPQLPSAESLAHQEVPVKLPRTQKQKQTRKVKEQHKQQKEDQEMLADSAKLENPNETLIKDGGGLPVVGSDTAALLSQISGDICSEDNSLAKTNATKACANERTVKDVSRNNKSKNMVGMCQDSDSPSRDHAASGEDKGRTRKPSVRKSRKAKVNQSESCNTEPEQSLLNASMEVNVDETSILNASTVTVSFEEFLQSQRQEDTANPEPDECSAESLNNGCTDENDVVLSAPQVSPRTLTVKAEVHPISPEHEAALGPKLKVASIFSRNKKEGPVKDAITSSSSCSNPLITADVLPDRKRKSNVVLHEEDLELDVVESSTTLKCTQEERKQFMNAFKQPSLEGSKGKPSKPPGKVKQALETVPETGGKEPEEKNDESNSDPASSEPCVKQKDSKSVGKKRGRRSVKKKQVEKAEVVQDSSEKSEELPVSGEVEKSCSGNESNKVNVKELRRSSRDRIRRQNASVPETNPTPCRTRGQKAAEKPKSETETQDDPAQASTTKSHKAKKSVYRAEMLLTPDEKGSPIRMKFTRVFPSSATKAGSFQISSPMQQESNSLKRRKQAKRLVQKAKAIQQSKQLSAAEPPPVRRSSRFKESVKTNYCEDKDSVMFLEDCVISSALQESTKSQKKLRSLNDVLGKNAPPNKASKNAAGSKLAPMFLERKDQKLSAIISIFDDSSREGSENSQDDEKFRAKREFLKSGLPESFKKQIAKVAANREAYTQACASFQPVVHVQQKTPDCAMWNLSWPENRFLTRLKEFYQLASVPVVSLESGNTTKPVLRTPGEKVSGWQEQFSESVQQRLVEEVTASNPSFPAQRFFDRFLKRQKDYLLQAATAEAECGSKTPHAATSTQSVGGKRKRVDEGEKTGKSAKKPKSNHVREEPIVIDDSPSPDRGGAKDSTDSASSGRGRRRRPARPARHKQMELESKPRAPSSPKKMQCDSPIIIDSPSSEKYSPGEGVREDVLWTEKYQPQHSSDVIGNIASVRKLHSWLKEWKLRADREERRKQQEKKQEDDSNDDSWMGGDSSEGLEDGDDLLCNTLLITGPTGVGKTAAVYACAQELGFKVFEVNCSSQRSGRQILSQLKEATQSHQVDVQGVNTHKPTYFNSYSSSSAGKVGSSPRKVNSPRYVVSSPRKPPQSPRGAKRKGGLAPTSLASLFRMAGSQDKKTVFPKKSTSVTQAGCRSQEPLSSTSDNMSTPEEQGKRTATSLILFEEVDVIFDDDSGFLAAVKTFMTTTKRPVVLTTSDPTFSAMFDGCFDEIHFKAPSVVNVTSYLQLLCLVENVWTDAEDLACLLRWKGCDVRQSLLHLQFWARSGGGCRTTLPVLPAGTIECEVKTENGTVENVSGTLPSSLLPTRHTGCTESMLGLLNIHQEKAVVDLLKCESSAEEKTRCWRLLSEAEGRGVDLLYSNMEVLLPLPLCPLPQLALRTHPTSNPEPQPVPLVRLEENTEDASPVKMSSRMRRKKQLCLDNKNVLQSDSESEDGFLSLPKSNKETKPARVQELVTAPLRMKRVKLSVSERKRSKVVSHCLNSLADHLEDMSFLDSSLYYWPPQAEGACRPHAFTWTGAEVKSGMTDEVRLDCEERGSGLDSVEIRAALGSLSFWKCKAGVSKAWNVAKELDEELRSKTVEELTLPVSSHRQGFSLIPNTACDPRVMETRKEVMSTVLTSRSFSTLGHRAAAALDYLPLLRTICRSEKLKEQGKVKRRFMHYLEGIHFDLPKSTIQQLASDFP